jgi:CHAT domain-containing protein
MAATVLVNRAFTRDALRQALASADYGVVHLATHGQFSSSASDTFLLAYDQTIPVTAIDGLLQPSRRLSGDSLQLLVLSACQTAAGDPAANLGLAAMAVRSGASATMASLWPVSDDATAQFMAAFYGAWQGGRISKADALRQAQSQLLASSAYQHPFYWAAFTLLGNWS